MPTQIESIDCIVLRPSEYDPALKIAERAQLGAYIINARIDSLVDTNGPDSKVFEKIYENAFVEGFRKFLLNKDVVNAGPVYLDVIHEIDRAIRQQIRKAARDARPVKGLVNMAIEAAVDCSGLGTAQKIGKWYFSATNPPPLGAAAFLMDLEK